MAAGCTVHEAVVSSQVHKMGSSHSVWKSVVVWMFVVMVLLTPCRGKHEAPTDKELSRRKESCYIDIDNGLWGRSCRLSWILKENCALRCVSASCYNTVYGEDHLEEGEVDFRRSREFRSCLRKELAKERREAK